MKDQPAYTIGEFARLTGLSVRTLHYYDEIGLLKATKDTSSGHRKYDREDLLTIQRIVCFKFMGCSLDTIKELMQKEQYGSDLASVLQMQRTELEKQRARLDTALNAVGRVSAMLERGEEVDGGVLASLIHSIQTEPEQREWLERHLPPDTVNGLFERAPEEMEALDREFIEMAKEVKRLMGRPADDPEVQALIERQMKLSFEFVGSDNMERLESLAELEESQLAELERMTPSPFTPEEEAWLQQAMAHYADKNGWNAP
jgi:Predicted transcriptional regulators